MTPGRAAAVAALSLALTACASPGEPRCGPGEHLAVQDSLYFGTGKPDGIVTTEEWVGFLESTVTPRFPQGLTVSQASGQWRGANGSIVRESTHVLQLMHPNDSGSDGSIAEIVAFYKARFQQEAVLRVRVPACVSF